MSPFSFYPVDKHEIKACDVIFHDGKERAVSKSDIKKNGFFGLTIFGDSYMNGYKKVLKGKYNDPRENTKSHSEIK